MFCRTQASPVSDALALTISTNPALACVCREVVFRFSVHKPEATVAISKFLNTDRSKPTMSFTANKHSIPTTDLITFDSWDYDASTASGHASLITSSFSGEDLSLSGTGQTSAFNKNSTDYLLRLSVSGKSFCVEPKVFQKLERLPWKTEATSPKAVHILSNSNRNVLAGDQHDFYLRTAPELFEIILSHVLYGSFPDVRQMRTADVEELEPLVMLLELNELQRYLQQQEPWVGVNSPHRKHRRVPSFRRLGNIRRGNPDHNNNKEDRSSLASNTAPNKSLEGSSTSLVTPSNEGSNNNAVRRMVKKTLGRRGGESRRRTHAEWCASDVVN